MYSILSKYEINVNLIEETLFGYVCIYVLGAFIINKGGKLCLHGGMGYNSCISIYVY